MVTMIINRMKSGARIGPVVLFMQCLMIDMLIDVKSASIVTILINRKEI